MSSTPTVNKSAKAATGYMAELDTWLDAHVIDPLWTTWDRYNDSDVSHENAARIAEEGIAAVKQALKDKLLESYRDGLRAGLRKR